MQPNPEERLNQKTSKTVDTDRDSEFSALNQNGCIKGVSTDSPDTVAILLELAKSYAVAPISGFRVGAFVVGKSGNIYLGANLEFAGAPLNASLHAEQSAILNAWMHGESILEVLYVTELPCGHCRQFLCELSHLDRLQIHTPKQSFTFKTLLPHSFGSKVTAGHGLLDSPAFNLETIHTPKNDLHVRAINAAQHSYAPYTQNPEGCVIECADGAIVSGRTAESVAFNPTVTALTCALNQRNLSTHRKEAIIGITFVKLATGLNAQTSLNNAVLKPITNAKPETVLVELR